MAFGMGPVMAQLLLSTEGVIDMVFLVGLVLLRHPDLSVPYRMMVIITLILDLIVNILVLD